LLLLILLLIYRRPIENFLHTGFQFWFLLFYHFKVYYLVALYVD